MQLVDQIIANRKARRRARKKFERFVDADVLIVSHGKSGRTWVRTLISHLYHQKYGIAESLLIHYDNFTRLVPEIPKICFMGHVTAPGAPSDQPTVRLSPEQKLILLLRDPRDIAVSFYFQVAKRATAVEKLRKQIGNGIGDMPIFDFVLDEQLGIPRVIERMNRWERELGGIEGREIVRYEDLHADTEGTLRRIAECIGGHFSDEQIRRAVAFASFETLREKEKQGFFDSPRLQPADAADPDSFKVRRGKVGGHRDYFSAEQLETIDELVRRRLSPSFGYGGAAGD